MRKNGKTISNTEGNVFGGQFVMKDKAEGGKIK